MTNNIFRKDDLIATECAKFIDEYFWGKTKFDFKRIPYDNDRKHRQMQKDFGIDFVLKCKDTNCYIDEKAKVNGYINKAPLRNSVEILSHFKDGWFIDSKKQTDKYAFICISCDNSVQSEYDVRCENITEMLYILVDRKELTEYFCNGNGIDVDTLRTDAWNLLKHDSRTNYSKGRLTCTRRWESKPVNLAFDMVECLELSKTKIFHITKEKYEKMSLKQVILKWKNCK